MIPHQAPSQVIRNSAVLHGPQRPVGREESEAFTAAGRGTFAVGERPKKQM